MLFPLRKRPVLDYHSGGRAFGAPRGNGRLHAACDLIAPVGTPVYAVAKGVVGLFYEFYQESWALEVDHTDFIVRYGEVTPVLPKGIAKGVQVSAGQVIAHVGALKGSNASMLHFELYSGEAEGPLTVRDGKPPSPYQRRWDLLDPTPALDEAELHGA